MNMRRKAPLALALALTLALGACQKRSPGTRSKETRRPSKHSFREGELTRPNSPDPHARSNLSPTPINTTSLLSQSPNPLHILSTHALHEAASPTARATHFAFEIDCTQGTQHRSNSDSS